MILGSLFSCAYFNDSENKVIQLACDTTNEHPAPLLSTLISKIEYIPLETMIRLWEIIGMQWLQINI